MASPLPARGHIAATSRLVTMSHDLVHGERYVTKSVDDILLNASTFLALTVLRFSEYSFILLADTLAVSWHRERFRVL